MFNLYSGNKLEDLSTLLVRILSLSAPENPFEQEHILVQSPGMAQWLKMYLAKQQGIAAGYEFPLPSTFVWRCFQQALDDIPDNSEFNKPFLVWRIMRLLDSRLGDKAFQQLNWYLAEDDSLIRRFQLCSSIADVYDQYLMYRPDWIAAWESGDMEPMSPNAVLSKKDINKFEEQAWQPILWRDLVADVSIHNQSLYHRANLIEALQEATHSKARPSNMPSRIFIFGVSALPPNTLQSLRVLAEAGWLDVHLFLQNPCRFYWGDIVDKKYLGRALKRQNLKPNIHPDTLHLDANPLLASWGRLGRDYIGELQSFSNDNLDVFEQYYDEGTQGSKLLEPTESHQTNRPLLLHFVQQDILEMENHGALEERALKQTDSYYKHTVTKHDQSVSLQVCHSALREVEVLHDHLLAMFESNAELTPKDVIVMLPDVNQYSPFVQAVFGQSVDKHKIPYSLIDQSANLENTAIDAYVGLLSLTDSRFTLSELISILEVPAVLETFDIRLRDVEQIRQWCHEVGIRWGLDKTTAENFSLPKQEQNTWHNGLSRMLLGYAIGHDGIWQNLLSYGEVEGLNAELAGKLASFLDAVRLTEQELTQNKKPSDWFETLHGIYRRFFTLQEQDPFPTLLSKHVGDMVSEWRHAYFEDELDISIIKALLAPRLQETQGSKRFLAGRVNFCTLMPMRSVPFKVVCLLGLNEGAYPRTVVPMGFDLMVGNYRSGDRSRREDDKYLFLEAVMSARESLYISYVGRTVKDNSELNPSILVSELMDYIGQSCVLENDVQLPPEKSQQRLLQHMITNHKLQPFHEQYYQSNNKYFSYDASWLPAVLEKHTKTPSLTQPATSSVLVDLQTQGLQIELDQLIRFYQHPARYFMQRRLNAFLQLQEVEESEDEPFHFDGLTRYQLKEALLSALQQNQLTYFLQRFKLSGKYPYGAFGDMEVEALIQQSQVMMTGLNDYHQIPLDAVNIDLLVPVSQGHGEIEKTPSQVINQTREQTTESVGKAAKKSVNTTVQDRLVAWLPLSNHNLALNYHIGELSAGKKISIWLSHLAYSAQGMWVESRVLSFKNNRSLQLVTHVITPMEQEKAFTLLRGYMALFRLGDRIALPLPPRTADAWCKAYLDTKLQELSDDEKHEAAWAKALSTYYDDFNDFAESKNVYWQRFFANLQDYKKDFTRYVLQVWLPLYQHFNVLTEENDSVPAEPKWKGDK